MSRGPLTDERRGRIPRWTLTARMGVMAEAAHERVMTERPPLWGDGEPGLLTEMRQLASGIPVDPPWWHWQRWWTPLAWGLLGALVLLLALGRHP